MYQQTDSHGHTKELVFGGGDHHVRTLQHLPVLCTRDWTPVDQTRAQEGEQSGEGLCVHYTVRVQS